MLPRDDIRGYVELIHNEPWKSGTLLVIIRLVPTVQLASLPERLTQLHIFFDSNSVFLLLFENLVVLRLEEFCEVEELHALYPIDNLRFQQGLLDWIHTHHIKQIQPIIFDLDRKRT